jgi:hypothetical protein
MSNPETLTILGAHYTGQRQNVLQRVSNKHVLFKSKTEICTYKDRVKEGDIDCLLRIYGSPKYRTRFPMCNRLFFFWLLSARDKNRLLHSL